MSKDTREIFRRKKKRHEALSLLERTHPGRQRNTQRSNISRHHIVPAENAEEKTLYMVHVECAVLTDNTLTDRSTVYMLRDYYVTIVCVLEQAVVFKCRLETCSILYCKSTNPITVKRACRYRLSPHEGAKNSRPLTLIS